MLAEYASNSMPGWQEHIKTAFSLSSLSDVLYSTILGYRLSGTFWIVAGAHAGQYHTMGIALRVHEGEQGSSKLSTEIPNEDLKNAAVASAGLSTPSELDADGEIKQDGVRRTEAITSVWDKKTLVLVFVTYVLPPTATLKAQILTKHHNVGYTLRNSSSPCCPPSKPI